MYSGYGNNRPRRENAERGGAVSLQRVHVARREVAGAQSESGVVRFGMQHQQVF